MRHRRVPVLKLLAKPGRSRAYRGALIDGWSRAERLTSSTAVRVQVGFDDLLSEYQDRHVDEIVRAIPYSLTRATATGTPDNGGYLIETIIVAALVPK
jgi:hypothetical protein